MTQIWKNLISTLDLARFQFLLRIENTVLGIIWYVLHPIFIFGIMYLVFFQNVGKNIPEYPWFVILGVISWNLFSRATTEAGETFNKYSAVIQKLPVDRELLVESSVLSSIYMFIIEMMLFLLIFFVTHAGISFNLGYFLLVIISFFMFIQMVSYCLSILFTRIKDLVNVWRIVLFGGWFLTPIFYSPNLIKGNLVELMIRLNPMTLFVELIRGAILYGTENWSLTILVFIILSLLMLIARKVFKQVSKNIVEYI